MATKTELLKQEANLNSQKTQLSKSFNVARGRVENLKKASGRLERAKENAEGILIRIKIMYVGSDWQGKRANEFRAAIVPGGGHIHNAGSDYLKGIKQAKEAVDAALRIAERSCPQCWCNHSICEARALTRPSESSNHPKPCLSGYDHVILCRHPD